MIRRTALAFSLLLITFPCQAAKLSCNLEESLIGPTYIELDTSTKVARILYPGLAGILDGHISRISKAGNGTDSYNLTFNDLPAPYNEQTWEFVLHRNSGDWYLFGSGYETIDGTRHLSSNRGQYSANCVSIEA